jgi:prepilin-type N-terminal cleavage/methylation domain-containing protein
VLATLRPDRRHRRGFTLAEILIALFILGVLAAVLYPTAAGQLRSGQSAALGNQLDNLRQAISNYRQNVTHFPSALSQLTTAPTAADVDACGTVLGATNTLWRGPYITQVITGNMPIADALAINALTRIPPTGVGAPGLLQIRVASVDSALAVDLERQFDGNANFATGTIQWTTLGVDTLKFLIPIRGC